MMIGKKKRKTFLIEKYIWYNNRNLISEKEFSKTNFEGLQEALLYVKNNLIDSDSNIYLTVDSLTEIYNIIIGSNDINLRKVKVKSHGFGSWIFIK